MELKAKVLYLFEEDLKELSIRKKDSIPIKNIFEDILKEKNIDKRAFSDIACNFGILKNEVLGVIYSELITSYWNF